MTRPRRESGRTVVIDDRDRVLLFRGLVRESPPRLVWYTPGGRLEPGETFEDAARRELTEETGLLDAVLGPCVWTRRAVRDTAEGEVEAHARFFLVRTSAFDVDVRGSGPTESIDEWRWWSLDELRRTPPTELVPPRLAELVSALLAGDIPVEPVDASDA